MTKMLSVENLTIRAKLDRGLSLIVEGLSFDVTRGTRLGIVGESGCGKTMTALALIGLLPHNCRAGGSARLDGTELLPLSQRELRRLRGREIVYIPQSGADFLNPSMTVRLHFAETLARLGYARSARSGAMRELLEQAGFSEPESVLKKYPFQLSGGMAQRVLLALALAAKPKLVIADEPTRGLHRDAALKFMDLLESSFSDCAVAIITHDRTIAERCDSVLEMRGHA
ncbi:MAG: ATP-binding cassette domain-containing protein [Oscillospiraceae bacterium]|jgi:ABC-type dipeptide/oligopeptide/nickel transport system ATPase component|nr:ATP-binding cassette domain-containing protein [Oscillospiraceae bacterium]